MFRRLKSSATAVVLLAAVAAHTLNTPVVHSNTTSTTRPAINRLNPGKLKTDLHSILPFTTIVRLFMPTSIKIFRLLHGRNLFYSK